MFIDYSLCSNEENDNKKILVEFANRGFVNCRKYEYCYFFCELR